MRGQLHLNIEDVLHRIGIGIHLRDLDRGDAGIVIGHRHLEALVENLTQGILVRSG
ncbi:hypothetical protein DSECCO2_469650 [anaerobic digester metagenome]